jgi:hypothetical protein
MARYPSWGSVWGNKFEGRRETPQSATGGAPPGIARAGIAHRCRRAPYRGVPP